MVSQALQLSMRVQQQVTELAIKGDDALATLRSPEESPAWATFDEDEPDQGSVRRSAFDAADPDTESDVASDVVPDTELDTEPDIEPGLGSDLASTDGASVAGDPWAAEERAMLHELDNTPAAETAIDTGSVEPRTPAADTAPSDTPPAETAAGPTEAAPGDTPAIGTAAGPTAASTQTAESTPAETTPAGTTAGAGATELGETPAAEAVAGPTVLPDYGELTLAQVRARMRRLSIAELAELVDFERAHADRPSFVGMLNRRIATLRDQR
jgi:hypothetical protein